MVLAAAAFWQASRSEPDRRPVAAPPPAVTAPAVRPPTSGILVDMAVGADAAYLLVGNCPDFTAMNCSQELLTSTGTGDWGPVAVQLPAVSHGFSSRLVAARDGVAVVDEDARAAYLVRGGNLARRNLTVGPPIAGWSPGLALDQLDERLALLDPVTGVRSPLATPPPVGELGAVRAAGPVIAAVGRRDRASWLAVSRDGGRHWSWVRVPIRQPAPVVTQLAVDAVGTVFVLIGRDTDPDVKNEFSQLLRFSNGTWNDITPAQRPRSASALVLDGERLLITEETGGLWALPRDGTLQRLPDPQVGDADLRLTYLVTGSSGVLLGQAVDVDATRSVVLSSADSGLTWTAFVP